MSMKKKGNGGFTNLAAKKFSDENRNRIDQMSEYDIYDILEKDLDEILDQLAKNKEGKGKFPKYIGNIGLNISAVKYLYKYIKKNHSAMEKEEKATIKLLISHIFTESSCGKYKEQDSEKLDRHEYLLDAFTILDKKRIKTANRLKLKDRQGAELALQSYLEPKYGVRFACQIIDRSSESIEKKFKIFKLLYKSNLKEAMGASLCVENKSEIVSYIFGKTMKLNEKGRKKVLRHYAETFKKNKRFNFFLKSSEFTDKKSNRRIMKALIKEDRGYKKAFDMALRSPTKSKSSDKKKGKKEKKEKKAYTPIKLNIER